MDTKMQRDQNEVKEEEVNSLGPTLHCNVSSSLPTSSTPQLWEKEGAEGVDFESSCFSRAPLHDQGKVEVYYLGGKNKHVIKRSEIQGIK